MPLTNAEKQRRYRQRRDADPLRRTEHKAKCTAKYQQDLAVGKIKHIKDMNPREQRSQRKAWKKRKIEQRKRKRDSNDQILTPPSSPGISPPPAGHQNTRRKNRNIAKCYRDNAKLMEQLQSLKRLNHRLNVRLQRQKKKSQSTKAADTPRTKTNKLLRNWSTEHGKRTRRERREMKSKAKKALLFQLALSEELKAKYKRSKKQQQNYLAELTTGRLIKKYKLIDKARKELQMKAGTKRFKKGSLSYRLESKIFDFYERDDNSKLTPGMKDTVTQKGVKKQRRILTDTIEQIHEKFLIENTDISISYTTFCRLRPFWVQPPKEADRDTCACKQHENMQFLADSLYKLKYVETKSLTELTKSFSCDVKSLNCMYGQCEKCNEVDGPIQEDDNAKTSWFQWKTKKVKRNIKGEEKEITITEKEHITDSINKLKESFSDAMKKFKIHAFNISNQISHYRTLKENMKPNEALIHIDFAENFQCKLANEIQGMHFGASKKQLTLHTGIYYTILGFKTFCAVSDSLDHNPSSVWAFIDPVLDKLLNENPAIDHVHFYSDGSAIQYKQKANFFLFTHEMMKRKLFGDWNFHESGHGKGVPDGVGGALKRKANDLVLHGKDIMNATAFVESTKDSSVFVYEVGQHAIDDMSLILSKETLKPVPGTLKVHQIRYLRLGEILYRDVSCTCVETLFHKGHQMKCHLLIDKKEGKENNGTNKRSKEDAETRETENKKAKRQQSPSLAPSKSETPVRVPENDTVARKYFFSCLLRELGKCKTFEEIQDKCTEIYNVIEEKGYKIDYKYSPNIQNTGLEVDERSLSVCPNDIPQNSSLYPVSITADGNCLPYSGSIIASGTEDLGDEIRVRIIVESSIYKDSYLNQTFLENGIDTTNNSLAKTYSLYSDEYTGEALSAAEIERIYDKEIIKITRNKSYMGIWQIFSLSSVLGRRIFSVYPNLGNPNVRKDLHRMIHPRETHWNETAYVMWTTTRHDMTRKNWVPNHFVVLLPIGQKDTKNKIEGEERKPDGKVNSDNNEEKETRNNINTSDHSPQDLLGKYVLVNYDDKLYPGIVMNCDETEVYVSCMHSVGKGLDNTFYWPLAVRDLCWYDMEKIIGTIPKPKLVGQKYQVDNESWQLAMDKLKK